MKTADPRAPRGRLAVVGLGPGDACGLPAESASALAEAHVLYGYGPYLARVPSRPGQERIASDNREEAARARRALEHAEAGAHVAMVSGGDPGVFAMAAAVCEQIERGPATWRQLDVRVLPGITAMLALAARVGAPLGNDFCAISLSDNRKPWSLIERRLAAAAGAGFVIALYNPISRARPWQLRRCFEHVAQQLAAETPIVFGRAIAREGESVRIVPLSRAAHEPADMSTLVLIGSSETRVVERPLHAPLVYTPRSVPFSLNAESPRALAPQDSAAALGPAPARGADA